MQHGIGRRLTLPTPVGCARVGYVKEADDDTIVADTWISWPSFLLGLIETVAYWWYIALVFGLLHNYFARRFA